MSGFPERVSPSSLPSCLPVQSTGSWVRSGSNRHWARNIFVAQEQAVSNQVAPRLGAPLLGLGTGVGAPRNLKLELAWP